MSFVYSVPSTPETIITPMMDQAWARIRNCLHARGQFVVVAGRAGAGKTTAMTYIGDQINADCESEVPNAFRTTYFISTDLLHAHDKTLERQILGELLSLGLDLSVARDMRKLRPDVLMQSIMVALRQRNIQMILIDEAGLIPARGLNVLANLLNLAATKYHWRLTIVLIGMNELPITVGELPQVERRVADTIWFEPYSAREALEVLEGIHPYFRSLDLHSEEGLELMEFLLSPEVSDGGLLGRMIPLVERTAFHCQEHGREFALRELRTVHLLEAMDRSRSLQEARRGYRGAHANGMEASSDDQAKKAGRRAPGRAGRRKAGGAR